MTIKAEPDAVESALIDDEEEATIVAMKAGKKALLCLEWKGVPGGCDLHIPFESVYCRKYQPPSSAPPPAVHPPAL